MSLIWPMRYIFSGKEIFLLFFNIFFFVIVCAYLYFYPKCQVYGSCKNCYIREITCSYKVKGKIFFPFLFCVSLNTLMTYLFCLC